MAPTRSLEGVPERGIHHSVGVPKPWDLGGSLLHDSYDRWRQALGITAINFNAYIDPQSWSRWMSRGRLPANHSIANREWANREEPA
jgi:hypothetical protein